METRIRLLYFVYFYRGVRKSYNRCLHMIKAHMRCVEQWSERSTGALLSAIIEEDSEVL